MTRVRVVVAEDEDLARERIVTLVRSSPELELVGEARHGLETLDLVTALSPELLLLDVQMPELNGFEVVAALDESSLPGLVFITAHEDYALRAFEVDAIDYLQKPVTPARFEATVRRALARLASSPAAARLALARAIASRQRDRAPHLTRFVVRRGSTHTFVPTADVIWIDAADNYLQLHTGGRPHLVRGTVKDAASQLDPATFLRIHRSAIVNINRIVAVEAQASGAYVVHLSDGTALRTSRQYVAGVRALVTPRAR